MKDRQHQIYFAGIGDGSVQDVKTLLEAAGFTASDVFLIKDHETQKSRGFGFASLSSQDDVVRAVEKLDGQKLGDRQISIRIARPKPARIQ